MASLFGENQTCLYQYSLLKKKCSPKSVTPLDASTFRTFISSTSLIVILSTCTKRQIAGVARQSFLAALRGCQIHAKYLTSLGSKSVLHHSSIDGAPSPTCSIASLGEAIQLLLTSTLLSLLSKASEVEWWLSHPSTSLVLVPSPS